MSSIPIRGNVDNICRIPRDEDDVSSSEDSKNSDIEEEVLDQSKHTDSFHPAPIRMESRKAFDIEEETNVPSEISYEIDHSSPTAASAPKRPSPAGPEEISRPVTANENDDEEEVEEEKIEPHGPSHSAPLQPPAAPQNLKKKPVHAPSTILINENSLGSKVLIAPPASPLVQTGPLHIKPETTVVVNEKLATLLWNGSYIWKVPFNGRGSPDHRIVAIKRATFPSIHTRRVQLVTKEGRPLQMEIGTFISYPPTLLWFHGQGKADAQSTARELVLYEGTRLTEGHNTPAFWKFSARHKPMPRPELCFSVVTSTRSLDMTAGSIEEAEDWKLALKLLLETFVVNPSIELTNRKATWGQTLEQQPVGSNSFMTPPPLASLPLPPGTSAPPLPPHLLGQQNSPSVIPVPPPQLPPLPPPPILADDQSSSPYRQSKGSSGSVPQQSSLFTTMPPNPPSPERSAITAEATKARKEALKKKLFSAAHSGDINGLREALLAGVPVNLMEPSTADTPLMICCRNGDAAMVKLCLQYGAKNDPHPDYGLTALHVAVEAGQLAPAVALLNAAASTQADVIVTNLTDSHGQTVLHLAALKDAPAMLELLLRHGSDPNRSDDVGLTAVHISAGVGYVSCLAVLLDHGGDASIDSPDKDLNTPLHHAASNGHIPCVKLLLESAADASAKNKAGQTPYQLANFKGHQSIALLLLDYSQQGSWTGGSIPPKPSPAKLSEHSRPKIMREHSNTSIDDSEDSSYSIDIQTPQKSRGSRSKSMDANGLGGGAGFTPVLKRKQSDEFLPRPHTASPSQTAAISSRSSSGNNLAGMGTPVKTSSSSTSIQGNSLSAGKTAVLVQRNPLVMSARETAPVSPLSASNSYAPLSARERSSQALFEGMEVSYPTSSPARPRANTGDQSPVVYSVNPIPTANPTSRANVYNAQRRKGQGAGKSFAEPLSEFDLYLMKGFEDGNSPYKRSDAPEFGKKAAVHDKEQLLDDDGESTDYGTPEVFEKTFVDFENSYEMQERNIDEPATKAAAEDGSGVYDAYQDATGLPDKLPYDNLYTEQLNDEQQPADVDAGASNSSSYETFQYEGEIWDIYMTDEGYYYYLNSVTYHSQWYDPREYGFIDESYNEAANEVTPQDDYDATHIESPDQIFEPVAEDAEKDLVKSPPRIQKGKSPSGSPEKKFRHSPARIPVALRKRLPGSSSDDSEEDEQDILARATVRTAHHSASARPRNLRSSDLNDSPNLSDSLLNGHSTEEQNNGNDDLLKSMDADWDGDNTDDAAHVGSDWDKDSVGGRTPKGAMLKYTSPSGASAIRTTVSASKAMFGRSVPSTTSVASPAESNVADSPLGSPSKVGGFMRPPPIVTGKSPLLNGMMQNQSQAQIPLPVNSVTEAPVAKVDPEVILQKFLKMKNIGIPTESIINQMKIEGIDESLIDRLMQTKGATPRRIPAKKEKLSPTPKKSTSPNHAHGAAAKVSPPSSSQLHSGAGIAASKYLAELKDDTPTKPYDSGAAAATGPSTVQGLQRKPSNSERRLWDSSNSSSNLSKTLSGLSIGAISTDTQEGAGLMAVSDEEEDSLFIEDQEEFQKLFGSKSSAVDGTSKVPMAGKIQQPSKLPEVLDRKRAENIIIGMLPFKAIGNPSTVFRAICSLDSLSGSLRVDSVEGLLPIMPSSIELGSLEAMKRSAHPAEEFLCLAAAFCPQLPKRLRCYITCETFQHHCSAVTAKCIKLAHVCKQILESEKLAKFLQNMAKVDAMLKQSQRDKPSDAGFTLKSLLKIISVKGADRKTSVLDYVVKNMREKGEDKIVEVTDDLQIVESAFEMSGLSIEQSANELLLQVGNLKSELRDAEASMLRPYTDPTEMNSEISRCNEKFCAAAKRNLAAMEPNIQRLTANLEEMKTGAVDLSRYFGHGDGIDDTDTTEIIAALKKLRQAIVTSRYIVTGEQRATTSGKMPSTAPPTAGRVSMENK